MDVDGKVVAITGAARGIGKATAAAFLAKGAKVAIGDLDVDLAKNAALELGAGKAGFQLDVSDPESFADFFDAAEAVLGQVDILVNNAGIMPTGMFLDETERTTEQMIDVNIRGVVNGSRLAARRFAARNRGHIVNIASLAGTIGEPGLATYCGTKHFVVGFTESLHRELKDQGIGVSAVLPGIINTELSGGTKCPAWMKRIAAAEPGAVADGIVAAVEKGRRRVAVPAALGVVLKALTALPTGVRLGITRAIKFDEFVSGADPVARMAYHQRLEEQQQ